METLDRWGLYHQVDENSRKAVGWLRRRYEMDDIGDDLRAVIKASEQLQRAAEAAETLLVIEGLASDDATG